MNRQGASEQAVREHEVVAEQNLEEISDLRVGDLFGHGGTVPVGLHVISLSRAVVFRLHRRVGHLRLDPLHLLGPEHIRKHDIALYFEMADLLPQCEAAEIGLIDVHKTDLFFRFPVDRGVSHLEYSHHREQRFHRHHLHHKPAIPGCDESCHPT